MRSISPYALSLALVTAVLVTSPADAQYRKFAPSKPATGEVYHVEFGAGLYNPTPELKVSSDSLNVAGFEVHGTEIDGVTDLGMAKHLFREVRLVLRPAKKHRFRFGYLPISYSGDTTVTRSITFKGTTYTLGLPVQSEINWKAWRFGYEYDFVYRNRGFAGVILEAKYTDIGASLNNPQIGRRSVHVAAPIPTIGGIVRVYAAANLAITGEVTGFKLPGLDLKGKRYEGRYLDFDVSTTLNFSDSFGVQAGYRSIVVSGGVDTDKADFVLKGPYIMAIARF